jgi:hypothetical protein
LGFEEDGGDTFVSCMKGFKVLTNEFGKEESLRL